MVKRRLLGFLILLTLLFGLPAVAVESFEDPAQQQRYREIAGQLRCLVCQGESIMESNAELAQDLRARVAQMMREGRSDEEIIRFMTDRYGDYVLFRPPMRPGTLLLWFGPFLLLFIGVFVLLRTLRRRAAAVELSDAQRRRARELLDGKQDL
ncbi:cytochrome c-type biogenesis protein CcmH [Alkalilimnicola sp. S0819]|uniref:cytochrome c-type biogenesis protein n=1 Tax=Alkalilimnicola sp. S0819 TaxID=2613922 RepID=UPI00126200DF|nr:cytochrome c-type biogenesis protein [Alkalilimnicola sp. S0819]KAB7627491.1 cytochrome c-type biogenesis protein CcmH [Alkalilimnicola sp. S0819]MPQ15644.1 cytochrome c-type biogenesis protein CcmH [Alkalilimnicola sp. S0819]